MNYIELFLKKNIEGIVLLLILWYVFYIYGEYSLLSTLLICYLVFFFFLVLSSSSLHTYDLYKRVDSSKHVIPHHIYTYWHDITSLSPLVKKCITSWKRHNPTYTIHLITKENLTEYVTIELPQASPQFHSDLIRLCVLAERGGIWMDASVFLTQPLDWVHRYQYNEQSEFVGYEQPTGETFPGVESWFFACVPTSSFIKKWRDEFLSSLSYTSTRQYITTLKEEGINLDHLYDPHYLCVYASSQRLLQNSHNFKLSLLNGNGPLSIQCMWMYPFYPILYKEHVVKFVHWTRTMTEYTGIVDYL
jgi:hypothetical protein